MFYSGRASSHREVSLGPMLARICMNSGLETLELTPGGKVLGARMYIAAFDPTQRSEIWDEASAKFARQASGAVTCFVSLHDPDARLGAIEIPALCHNPSVTAINGIPIENIGTTLANQGISCLFEQVHESLRQHALTSLIGDGARDEFLQKFAESLELAEVYGWGCPIMPPRPKLES